jgi:phosphatidylglycerophosphatase A
MSRVGIAYQKMADEAMAKNYQSISASTILRNPVHFFAFGFGSGLVRQAPGTWGTLAAIPVYFVISDLPLIAYSAVVITAFILGVWLCGASSRALGVHDHPGIVWDEIVGYLITMTAVPLSWSSVLLGFILFRVFDIWKPWPISLLDRKVHGGFGIMIDDVLAAVYAAISLQLVLRLISS